MYTSNCPNCKNPYKGFVDDLSVTEYKISGLCQACQDRIFGKPTLPKGYPTGKCPNCGNMAYNNDTFCSPTCSDQYLKYLKEA